MYGFRISIDWTRYAKHITQCVKMSQSACEGAANRFIFIWQDAILVSSAAHTSKSLDQVYLE